MNNKAKLSSGDRHKYTDKDLALFSLLSERDKMLANGEKFTLEKTKRQGPRPAEFWLERRRA